MEVRRFGRVKKVIWDQLLATKVEIILGKLYFHFVCIFKRSQYRYAVKVSDYILLQSVNEHHNCVIQPNIPFESNALIKPDKNIFFAQ